MDVHLLDQACVACRRYGFICFGLFTVRGRGVFARAAGNGLQLLSDHVDKIESEVSESS